MNSKSVMTGALWWTRGWELKRKRYAALYAVPAVFAIAHGSEDCRNSGVTLDSGARAGHRRTYTARSGVCSHTYTTGALRL